MRAMNHAGTKALLYFLAGCSLTSSLFAATEPTELVTDRPDQTESSRTVQEQAIQIETGWLHSRHRDDDLETDAFPQTLLRYGLAENLELRLDYEGYIWENAVDSASGAADNEGSGDLAVGFKLKLCNERDLLPEVAIVSHLSLPAGKKPFSSERYDPDYRLAFSHTLSERLSFGYNLGQAWVSEEDDASDRDTRSEFIYTAALGIGLSDRLGGFVEFFGEIPTGSDGGPANSFDGGFTYLMKDNLQLDVSSGVGLSDDADDWFIAAGLSVRFP